MGLTNQQYADVRTLICKHLDLTKDRHGWNDSWSDEIVNKMSPIFLDDPTEEERQYCAAYFWEHVCDGYPPLEGLKSTGKLGGFYRQWGISISCNLVRAFIDYRNGRITEKGKDARREKVRSALHDIAQSISSEEKIIDAILAALDKES
jgi:hypothetical protein